MCARKGIRQNIVSCNAFPLMLPHSKTHASPLKLPHSETHASLLKLPHSETLGIGQVQAVTDAHTT